MVYRFLKFVHSSDVFQKRLRGIHLIACVDVLAGIRKKNIVKVNGEMWLVNSSSSRLK